MFILGINAFHADSAACLLHNGRLVAAAEEERFRRIKHWAGLPTHAIRFCLSEAKIAAAEIDHVALNRDPRANRCRRALFVLRHRLALGLVCAKLKNLIAAQSISAGLGRAFGVEFRGQFHHIEHHQAHLASAYLASGFAEAVCVSVDGCGDFASTAWGVGNGVIDIRDRIFFPHSLGIFYTALTQWLGFRNFGDEYKVMGLAAYGRPRYLSQVRRILKLQPAGGFELELKYFRHHLENVSYHWDNCAPEVGTLYTPALESLLGPAREPNEPVEQRHKDFAASAQAVYEEAFFSLLTEAYRQYGCGNLALAGGCALNSVANGKIHARTPFKRLYVPPAAGDAGGAIGAALAVWQKVRRRETEDGGQRTEVAVGIPDHDHAYSGPRFDNEVLSALLRRRGLLTDEVEPALLRAPKAGLGHALGPSLFNGAATFASAWSGTVVSSDEFDDPGFRVTRHDDMGRLCAMTARMIAEGKVVGWFQGRMEWGPRALGNRSILCDPRRSDMKQILNAKIKHRESFRPFAPAILRGHVAEWFEQNHDVPFMSAVFHVRREKRALIPAVTHADGSGRLQTVRETTNPLFYKLIEQFYSLTSVPLLLNTSFNEQEPIVCLPEEALDCFLRTKMDLLVLGPFMVSRQSES